MKEDNGTFLTLLLQKEKSILHCFASLSESQLSIVAKGTTSTCASGDTADHVLELMTKGRFRHIPVVENDEMIGLISIGDVVKALLRENREENQHMRDYLASA